jgi:exosortase/archaeosortase family protein
MFDLITGRRGGAIHASRGRRVNSGILPTRHGPGRHRTARQRGSTGPRLAALTERLARSHALTTAGRLLVCLGCIGLSLVIIKDNERFRDFEAWLASHVVAIGAAAVTGHIAGSPMLWVTYKPGFMVGLDVTPECTVALLTIPFLLATAALVWARTSPVNSLVAVAAAAAMLMVANQLRILTIVWFIKALGFSSGFYWGHVIVGSAITIFAIVTSLVIFTVLAVRRGGRSEPLSASR